MKNKKDTLGKIIRAFKAKATRLIRQNGFRDFEWQRNYYEHIIRNKEDLRNTRNYIKNNPLKWSIEKKNGNIPE